MRFGRWFRFRDLPWAGGRLARRLLYITLPIRLHLWIARARGWARSRVTGAPRPVVENLRSTVIGEDLDLPELERIARRSLAFRTARHVTKILPTLPGFDDPRRWPVYGLERLEGALGDDRGVILIGAHFGYSPLIAPILRAHGYDVVRFIADLNPDRRLDRRKRSAVQSALRRFLSGRTRVVTERFGPLDLPASLNVRPIFHALSRNRIVYVAADGMRAMHFAKVTLAGRTYPLPTGFMKIAVKTGSPVLPAFAFEGSRRDPIVVEIESPLRIDPAASLEENLQRFAGVFEARLRMHPHLWDRWKVKDLFETALHWMDSAPEDRYRANWEVRRERSACEEAG